MNASRPTTSWPSQSSRSHRCEPMNPAAPVTRHFIPEPPCSLGKRDKETRRQGDKEKNHLLVSLSPCLLVSLPTRPSVVPAGWCFRLTPGSSPAARGSGPSAAATAH